MDVSRVFWASLEPRFLQEIELCDIFECVMEMHWILPEVNVGLMEKGFVLLFEIVPFIYFN